MIEHDSNTYSVIGITEPRQTGKTTLVKHLSPKMHYVNLEDLSQKEFTVKVPKPFLTQGGGGMIIDEIQKVPELLSYIQIIVEEKQKPGMFIITGSQNFLSMEQISQSMPGRISLFTLLLFLNEVMFKGIYPGLYTLNYIIRFLKPYFSIFNKQTIKTPKIYSKANGMHTRLGKPRRNRESLWRNGGIYEFSLK